MAVLRPLRAPLRIGAASHVFDFVQRILHERFQIRPQIDVRASEIIAGIDRQHRFGLHVLAPLKKFEQPHSIGRAIAPRTLMSVTLFDGANGLLPVKARFNRVTFDVITTGKTEEFRVQVHQHLHEVLAKTIWLAVPRRREK